MGSLLKHVVFFFLDDACRMFFFFFFSCGMLDLVPRPESNLDQNAESLFFFFVTRVQSLNQWTIREVPIALLDNCGYSLIVLHSLTADSFLQFHCIVESESTSVILYSYIKIHCLAPWMDLYFDLGRKTFSFYSSTFCFWGLRIKLTKDRVTGGKKPVYKCSMHTVELSDD